MELSSLDRLRIGVGRFFVIGLWFHLPIVAAIGLANDTSWIAGVIVSAVLAGICTASWLSDKGGATARYLIAVALVADVSLMVWLAHGRMQIDLHMYYFAAFAVLTAFCDWRVIVLAAAATAVHHLGLNFLLPMAVFPDGANFWRVVLHAVIVVVESATLIWLTHHLTKLFADNAHAIAEMEGARKREMEATQERQRVEQEALAVRRRATLDMADHFEASIKEVVESVTHAASDLRATAQSMSATATSTTDRATSASAAASEASTNVEAVAAASERFSASIAQIGRQVNQASEITNRTTLAGERTSETVQHLAVAAQKIGGVLQLIQEIAGQTNLLALNATIEAARAGEAGKGFAVVASEVKLLANQTAKATDDIRTQIAAIQNETKSTSDAIDAICHTIGEISAISAAIASAVDEQGATTREISDRIQEVATGTRDVAVTIGTVSDAANDTGSAAAQMLQSSEKLAHQSSVMRSEVEQFLATVRAA
ncbi:MAG TPA: methyl-accepting chemotaxis protein [Magnetospirillaceae bacterium]|jgi:methyl-accepting chemotaxis protein